MRRVVLVLAALAVAAPAAARHIPYGDPALPDRVTCDSATFRLDALRRPTGVERRRGAEYRALRRVSRREKRLVPQFPTRGFRVLSRQARFVTFGAGHPPMMIGMSFQRVAPGRWRFVSYGPCAPLRPTHPTGFAAGWRLDPSAPRPTRQSTEIPVLVREQSCASGEPATGRIEEPRVFTDERRVIAALFVRPAGDAFCQGNPETPHVLRLAEPLGERRLLDGGIVPARERFAP